MGRNKNTTTKLVIPGGDPRRADCVHELDRSSFSTPSTDEPELYMLFTLLAGGGGLLLKSKLSAWLSLFFCLITLANTKAAGFKQLLPTFLFSCCSIASAYFSKQLYQDAWKSFLGIE